MIGLDKESIHPGANSKLKKHSPSVAFILYIRHNFSEHDGTEATRQKDEIRPRRKVR